MTWLDYNDIYAVSDDGLVMNKQTGRVLKPYRRPDTYLEINLGRNIRFLIHRLVALLFLPKIDMPQLEVDHINRDKTNNCAYNLRWVDTTTNNLNKLVKTGSSGEKYIRHDIRCKKTPWNVRIQRYNESVFDGWFKTIQEAITARDNFINSM